MVVALTKKNTTTKEKKLPKTANCIHKILEEAEVERLGKTDSEQSTNRKRQKKDLTLHSTQHDRKIGKRTHKQAHICDPPYGAFQQNSSVTAGNFDTKTKFVSIDSKFNAVKKLMQGTGTLYRASSIVVSPKFTTRKHDRKC